MALATAAAAQMQYEDEENIVIDMADEDEDEDDAGAGPDVVVNGHLEELISSNNNNNNNNSTYSGYKSTPAVTQSCAFQVGDLVWFDPNQFGYSIPGKVVDYYADLNVLTVEGCAQPSPDLSPSLLPTPTTATTTTTTTTTTTGPGQQQHEYGQALLLLLLLQIIIDQLGEKKRDSQSQRGTNNRLHREYFNTTTIVSEY